MMERYRLARADDETPYLEPHPTGEWVRAEDAAAMERALFATTAHHEARIADLKAERTNHLSEIAEDLGVLQGTVAAWVKREADP